MQRRILSPFRNFQGDFRTAVHKLFKNVWRTTKTSHLPFYLFSVNKKLTRFLMEEIYPASWRYAFSLIFTIKS